MYSPAENIKMYSAGGNNETTEIYRSTTNNPNEYTDISAGQTKFTLAMGYFGIEHLGGNYNGNLFAVERDNGDLNSLFRNGCG